MLAIGPIIVLYRPQMNIQFGNLRNLTEFLNMITNNYPFVDSLTCKAYGRGPFGLHDAKEPPVFCMQQVSASVSSPQPPSERFRFPSFWSRYFAFFFHFFSFFMYFILLQPCYKHGPHICRHQPEFVGD